MKKLISQYVLNNPMTSTFANKHQSTNNLAKDTRKLSPNIGYKPVFSELG